MLRTMRNIAMIIFWLTSLSSPLYADDVNAGEPEAAAREEYIDGDGYESMSKLVMVMQMLRKQYLDSDKVDYDDLVKGALRGMLRGLDPYSSYADPEEFEDIIEETEGNYSGIGVVVSMRGHRLEVISPLEGGPGVKAGILPGDIITEVDDKPVANLQLHECVRLMKGEIGTNVKLTVYRPTDDETLDFNIIRAKIRDSGVHGAKMLNDGIAYMRLGKFAGNTPEMLDEKLAELKRDGMKALILDLRGNPGGLLTSGVAVCSRFLPSGEMIVFTEDREKRRAGIMRSADDCEKHLDLPMVVLIDEYSASASEIVAGCLKDYKRAIIVGDTSFGKGLVQTMRPLPDDSAVRFTTARYFTPGEKPIQDNGIEPDIFVDVPIEETRALVRARGLRSDTKIPDRCLDRAVELLRGIELFRQGLK